MLKGKTRDFFICLLIGLTVTGAWWLIFQKPFDFLEYLSYQFYDSQLKNYVAKPHPEKILIIDIDERSLNEYGQWPWPRYLLAEIQKTLAKYQAKTVTYSWVMSEKDRSSPKEMKTYIAKTSNENLSWINLPSYLEDYDHTFAQTLTNPPTILGGILINSNYERKKVAELKIGYPLKISQKQITNKQTVNHPGILWGNNLQTKSKPSLKETILTDPDLYSGNLQLLTPILPFIEKTSLGFVNVHPDHDGKIRKIKLIHEDQKNFVVHIALRNFLMEKNITDITIQKKGNQYLSITDKDKKFELPLSYDGSIFLHFHGHEHDYPTISAYNLLNHHFDPKLIKDKIIFIGSSTPLAKNLVNTPLELNIPTVEIHASILDNLINKNFIIEPISFRKIQPYAIVIAGIILTVFGSLFSLAAILLTCSLATFISIVTNYYFSIGLFFNPVYLISTMISVTLALLIAKSFLNFKQREILREAFNRYLSPEMVKQIEEQGHSVFTGQKKEVTLMFVDIRSFTQISEKLLPDQVANLLNQYFTPMIACVKKHHGTIDKLIGDGMMAFWNAPLTVAKHPQKAINTALDMLEIVKELNTTLIEEFKVTLKIGIGIHTGEVYVGNMGSQDFLNYTCIGDNVNLTSRVENLCKYYEFPLLATHNCAQKCHLKSLGFRTLDTIRVKGKKQPTVIQAILTKEEMLTRKDEFNALDIAIATYKKGDFITAINLFEQIKNKFPLAQNGCELYITRCQKLLTIPNLTWDGVWSLKNK